MNYDLIDELSGEQLINLYDDVIGTENNELLAKRWRITCANGYVGTIGGAPSTPQDNITEVGRITQNWCFREMSYGGHSRYFCGYGKETYVCVYGFDNANTSNWFWDITCPGSNTPRRMYNRTAIVLHDDVVTEIHYSAWCFNEACSNCHSAYFCGANRTTYVCIED